MVYEGRGKGAREEGVAGQVHMNSSSQGLHPGEGNKTATTGTTDIEMVGCQPVQRKLCTLPAFSTVVGNKVTKTVSTEPTVEKTTQQ